MKISKFVVLSGDNVKIDTGSIVILAKEKDIVSPDKEETNRPEIAEVRCDKYFSSGLVKFRFVTDTENSGFILALAPDMNDENTCFAGYSYNYKTFAVGTNKEFKDKTMAKAGSLKNLDLTKAHDMRIEVFGSQLSLFVDDVLICEGSVETKEAQLTFRATTEKTLKIFDIEIENVTKKAFVIMQFSKQYDEIYEEVIKPVFLEYGIETVRADEYYTSTPIINDIIKSIRESAIIIADITPDNPNVFYEIGYSHAINKPVILLSDKSREKLPFDVSSFRTIFYENSIAGKKRVEQSLRKYLKAML